MFNTKCPGQDTRYWTADDIFEEQCPHCGGTVEFWKTDVRLRCPHCRKKVVNPRFNLGCAQWCAYAEQCLGSVKKGVAPRSLRQVLESELNRLMHGLTLPLEKIKSAFNEVEHRCREKERDPLALLAALVVVGAKKYGRLPQHGEFLQRLEGEHHFPDEAVKETGRLVENILARQVEGDPEKLILEIMEHI